MVFEVTLDDRELEARLLFVPDLEPTLRSGFLADRLAGSDFLLPTVLGVGVGERDPPLEDAGVDRRDPVREFGVSERSFIAGKFLFRLFLAANISLASSSSAAVASSAASCLADLFFCRVLLRADMTQSL